MKLFIHSTSDVITNSSDELYTYSATDNAKDIITEFIGEILDTVMGDMEPVEEYFDISVEDGCLNIFPKGKTNSNLASKLNEMFKLDEEGIY